MIHEGTIRLTFTYAAGATLGRFLVALRDEAQLTGSRCPSCQRVLCPPKDCCPRCGDPTGAPVAVGPAGTLVSFTEQAPDRVFGLVRLDGADTALLHRLVGDGPWTLGMRVRARFATQREGAITDLEGFER